MNVHIRNTRGFLLPMSLFAISALMVIWTAVYQRANDGRMESNNAYKAFQASNYAKEGMEMMKAYIITQTNLNREDGWNNNVSILSGKFVVRYDNNGYYLENINNETITQKTSINAKYIRTIEVSNGTVGSDEKQIKVTVNYGGPLDNVQYTTSLTNIYES